MHFRSTVISCCAPLLLIGCVKKPANDQVDIAKAGAAKIACLSTKGSDQLFEYRNLQATTFKRGDRTFIGVYGCLTSNQPGKVQSVSVNFTAFDSNGMAIGTPNGQQMLTPTGTFGALPGQAPIWVVPAAAELLVELASAKLPAKAVEVKIGWIDVYNKRRQETYWIDVTPSETVGDSRQQPDPADRPAYEPDATRANCAPLPVSPRFAISDLKMRIVGTANQPIVTFTGKLKNPTYATMNRLWLTFSAFDKAGNFIGSNGSAWPAKETPPNESGLIENGFAISKGAAANISDKVLLTFQWYAKGDCRWTENHYVDVVRQ